MQTISKARLNANTEKITKRFYNGFKKEHCTFLKSITGIRVQAHAEWYTSLLLTRLMFIYFIQKKGFLDNDIDYLKNKLQTVRRKQRTGKSFSFYRDFLRTLFHQGFAAPGRSEELVRTIGNVPYLQGGIFEIHPLEKEYTAIAIEDDTFENVFRFFDQYEWQLDTRAVGPDRYITPDVIGYLFEKYINDHASTGAYYTQEDVTEYISKNCILPVLFDRLKKHFAFMPDSARWQMLAGDPDRYIYDAVKHGCDQPLPAEINTGITNVCERSEWNKRATSECGLPTETWREVVERRKRFEVVRSKLVNKELTGINDFITYNLNIRQFSLDILQQHEAPDFIEAFYITMAGRKSDPENSVPVPGIAILDPTCGSGAFLFAALAILEPLYETCISRMEKFVEDDDKRGGKKYSYFRRILKEMTKHPGREYFIYKSIILNNLYGVDSMKDATDVVKLRLFLKLIAGLKGKEERSDLGWEHLPDLDFNIRTGNALVGFAREEQWREGADYSPDNVRAKSFIEEKYSSLADAYTHFKETQWRIEDDGGKLKKVKDDLDNRLQELTTILNKLFYKQYTNIPYKKWLHTHQPFHWFAEYYGSMKAKGGFDCVIGNPPYLEMQQVDYKPKGYTTIECGAIHAMCIERSLSLLNATGSVSMVVPLSLVCTQRMMGIQKLLKKNRTTWYSNYAWRPGKLFENVNRSLSIFISSPTASGTFTTRYMRWHSEARPFLMRNIAYVKCPGNRPSFWIPKFTIHSEYHLLSKIVHSNFTFSSFPGGGTAKIYYRTTGGLYWKIFTNFSPRFFLNGTEGKSSRETFFAVRGKDADVIGIAILNSNTYWWWYTITSNLRDLNPIDIFGFRFSEAVLKDQRLVELGTRLLADLDCHSELLQREQKHSGTTKTQSFKVSLSKPIIDEIDRVLAEYYEFTDEELDFIINYDIKYRMGDELCPLYPSHKIFVTK
jgi:hypothetical protein